MDFANVLGNCEMAYTQVGKSSFYTQVGLEVLAAHSSENAGRRNINAGRDFEPAGRSSEPAGQSSKVAGWSFIPAGRDFINAGRKFRSAGRGFEKAVRSSESDVGSSLLTVGCSDYLTVLNSIPLICLYCGLVAPYNDFIYILTSLAVAQSPFVGL